MHDMQRYLVTEFNNDTNAERYNPTQARIAWNDMLGFFSQHLAG